MPNTALNWSVGKEFNFGTIEAAAESVDNDVAVPVGDILVSPHRIDIITGVTIGTTATLDALEPSAGMSLNLNQQVDMKCRVVLVGTMMPSAVVKRNKFFGTSRIGNGVIRYLYYLAMNSILDYMPAPLRYEFEFMLPKNRLYSFTCDFDLGSAYTVFAGSAGWQCITLEPVQADQYFDPKG